MTKFLIKFDLGQFIRSLQRSLLLSMILISGLSLVQRVLEVLDQYQLTPSVHPSSQLKVMESGLMFPKSQFLSLLCVLEK